jgi:flagellar biosynthesis regulator FlbT
MFICDYIYRPKIKPMKELNQKLAIVQTKLKAKKSSYNSFGKYYFRKSEDILEAIKPFLMEQGVTVTINEEIISTDPVPILQSTATISDGENAIHATALVGVDLNQKGMQTAQQFGAASTYGKKYALGNLLLIDDTEDADAGDKPSKAIDKIKQAAKPDITTAQLKQAKEYIMAGGDVEAIKTKYKLTASQEKALINERKANIKEA